MRWLAAFVVLLSLGVVLAGCSGSPSVGKKLAEKQMEKALEQGGATHADVDLGGGGNVDLAGLPEEFRQPGAVGIAHVGGSDAETRSDTYILQTAEAPAAVVAAYKQRLAGWKQVAVVETPNGTALNFESPDGARHASIMVGKDDNNGRTQINVSLAGK